MKEFVSDIFDQMRETPQRKKYHPEGDVFTHTAYVRGALDRYAFDLTPTEKETLIWTILFHDIGKIDTTKRNEKYGHWAAYGHAKVSSKYVDVMKFLIPTGIDTSLVQFLVENHMKIKFRDEMSDSKLEDLKAEAGMYSLPAWKLLLVFSECDDMLAYFDRTSEEDRRFDLKAFGDFTDSVLTDCESGAFASHGDPNGTLVLVRGVPGSGKTAFSRLLKPDVRVSADDFFTDDDGNYNFDASNLSVAHAWCQNQVFEAMRDGKGVIVVDNTFTQTWEMGYYFQVASLHNYRVHSIIKENRHDGKSIHGVPEKHVERMKDRFNVRL